MDALQSPTSTLRGVSTTTPTFAPPVPRRRPGVPTALVLGLLVGVGAFSLAGGGARYDITGVLLVGPPLLAVGAALLARALDRERDRVITRIVVAGFLLKLLGVAGRFYMAFDLYGGVADATRYVGHGQELARSLRAGILPPEAWATGSEFMDFLTGVVFALVGPTTTGGFLVFGLLAFTGSFLFYRAFVIAVPDGNRRLYAALVFLAPTMVFWPSSIGKEAWMVLTLGMVANGGARLLSRSSGAYPMLLAGMVTTFAVRPHMAALAISALGAAFLLRPLARDVRGGGLGWLVGVGAVVSMGLVAVGSATTALPQDEEAGGSVIEQVFAETEDRTSKGGSQFDNRPVRTPADVPHAVLTVPFRPLPFDANNAQALLVSLEGVALLALVVWSWRGFLILPRRALRRPYIAYAAVYTLLFIIAFSYVGNFALLARQRAQLLPVLAVLVAQWPRERETSRSITVGPGDPR